MRLSDAVKIMTGIHFKNMTKVSENVMWRLHYITPWSLLYRGRFFEVLQNRLCSSLSKHLPKDNERMSYARYALHTHADHHDIDRCAVMAHIDDGMKKSFIQSISFSQAILFIYLRTVPLRSQIS